MMSSKRVSLFESKSDLLTASTSLAPMETMIYSCVFVLHISPVLVEAAKILK